MQLRLDLSGYDERYALAVLHYLSNEWIDAGYDRETKIITGNPEIELSQQEIFHIGEKWGRVKDKYIHDANNPFL
jgi:hypothetical protein